MKSRIYFLIAVIAVALILPSCLGRGILVRGDYVENADCGLDMKMIRVDGGTFHMGAYDDDKDAMPIHTVTLDGYFISECEITQSQWIALMGYNISNFTGVNHPVDNVSWDEALAFCRELSRITGKHYTLPTEAQWEYAASGGKKSQGYVYSGSYSPGQVAWFKENNGVSSYPVKQAMPNELGLFDMSGNVLEWCMDWYDKDYYHYSPEQNPTGPAVGTQRVLRGGSWRGTATNCRVSHRRHSVPSHRSSSIGFRVVCIP